MTDEVISLPAPLTDVCRRWKHMLFPEFTRPIERGDPLLPPAIARQAIAELDAALAPMGFNEAKDLAKRLLALYPATASKAGTEAHQIFVTGLLEILMKYPFGIGEAAVSWLMEHRTFLHHADLAQACESQTAPLRRAKAIAEAHIRATVETPEPTMTPDEKAEIAALLAQAAERLRRKSANRPEDDARRASLKAMTDDEFKADTLAMLARMQADEPAYRARMAKANAYVLGLKVRSGGAEDR